MNNKALYTTFSAICGCAGSVAGFDSMPINFLFPFYFNGCHSAETSSFKKISNYTFKKCTYMLGNSTRHAAKMGGKKFDSKPFLSKAGSFHDWWCWKERKMQKTNSLEIHNIQFSHSKIVP